MVKRQSISQNRIIKKYYRVQSKFYDLTRWAFLFGRTNILNHLSIDTPPKYIVEIGCGTGHNLIRLAKRFPNAQITGFDVSSDMLKKARKKTAHFPNIRLVEKAYGNEAPIAQAPDLILFSYVLTMVGKQYSAFIIQAYKDLKPNGKIVVVDFHNSKLKWFKRHMKRNHVKMDSHLDQPLTTSFQPIRFDIKSAYLGCWNYFFFEGEKKANWIIDRSKQLDNNEHYI